MCVLLPIDYGEPPVGGATGQGEVSSTYGQFPLLLQKPVKVNTFLCCLAIYPSL